MKINKFALLVIIMFVSTSTLSTDGVVEINHICATQLGCFSGDSVGYPITIDGTAGKSYRLTSNLIVPDENTNGIDVDFINVSIDLNGFSIVRSGCENSVVNCTAASGTAIGISVDNISHFGLSVINGSIIGMGADGINNIAGSGYFNHLKLNWNRGKGLITRDYSQVFNSNASNNGGNGIEIYEGSMAKNNVVAFNGIHGLSGFEFSIMEGNISNGNVRYGIEAGVGAIVKGNTVSQNNEHGVWCYDSMVSHNSISTNVGSGIYAFSGCNAQENSILDNNGFGIDASPSITLKINVIQRNTIIGNSLGTINGSHYFNFGKNFCETDDICP